MLIVSPFRALKVLFHCFLLSIFIFENVCFLINYHSFARHLSFLPGSFLQLPVIFSSVLLKRSRFALLKNLIDYV